MLLSHPNLISYPEEPYRLQGWTTPTKHRNLIVHTLDQVELWFML